MTFGMSKKDADAVRDVNDRPAVCSMRGHYRAHRMTRSPPYSAQ